MRSFAILAFLAFSACGKVDNSPPPDAVPDAPDNDNDGIRSGTRLKVRWNDFDGTKSFAGMFDTARNELCIPRKFLDAKTYCVPAFTAIGYRDAACTQPIGWQFRSCPLTPILYFTENDPLSCDNLPKKIFPRGAPLSLPSFYLLGSTGCGGLIDSSGYDLYALGPEIPLTEFATIKSSETVEPDRIQQRFFESSDGARSNAVVYDNELGSECTLTLDATRGNARCVPTTTSLPGIYGDAGCTQQRTSFREGCPVPKYASRFSQFCSFVPSVPEIYRTGALASALYSGSPASCTAFTASPTLSYYSISATPSQLSTVPRAPDAEGTGRYRLLHYTSGGSSLRDTVLYDTTRRTECAPTTMQDGSVRCLPINIYNPSFVYFSDAGCTVPQPVIIVPNAPAAGCSLPPLPAFATRSVTTTTPACTVTHEVRAMGGVYTGTLYRLLGNCVSVTFTGSTVYTLGAVSAFDDFPQATVVTEP